MLLNKLLEDIEVLENEETGNPDISLVCADSRKAVPGCMFVCLEGGADDGHLHIREAALSLIHIFFYLLILSTLFI